MMVTGMSEYILEFEMKESLVSTIIKTLHYLIKNLKNIYYI